MAGIKTLGGDTAIADGWIRVSVTTDSDGKKTIVYRGGLNNFSKARAYVAKAFPTAYDITESKDTESGTGEITVTGTNVDPDGGGGGGGGDEDPDTTATPTCTLQGQMVAVPLYQAPYFNLGTDMTLQDLRAIDTMIREYGTVTLAMIAGFNKKVQEYAQWLFVGEKNFLKECYMLTVVQHLENVDGGGAGKAQARIVTPGTVIAWSAIWSKCNVDAKYRPQCPDSATYWLPLAPTVNVSATEVTLTQAFQGAAKFPNYYPDGTWEPPSLDGTTK